jgi:hypothetical protein
MNAKDAIKQVRQESAPEAPTETPASATSGPITEAPTYRPDGPWEPWMQTALDTCKKRFIDERVNGFQHRGKAYAPVPLEEAQQRWAKKEESFKGVLQNDTEVGDRLREQFNEAADAPAQGTGKETPPAEPPAT